MRVEARVDHYLQQCGARANEQRSRHARGQPAGDACTDRERGQHENHFRERRFSEHTLRRCREHDHQRNAFFGVVADWQIAGEHRLRAGEVDEVIVAEAAERHEAVPERDDREDHRRDDQRRALRRGREPCVAHELTVPDALPRMSR